MPSRSAQCLRSISIWLYTKADGPSEKGLPAAKVRKAIIKDEAFKLEPQRWVGFQQVKTGTQQGT